MGKKKMNKTIIYEEFKILLKTNDIELVNGLINEYKYHLKFLDDIPEKKIITVNVFKSPKMYIKYFKEIKRGNRKSALYCEIRRDNILVMDKEKLEIFIIYDEFNDEKLQYVGEIIFSIFGKQLEDKGYLFLHAACVSKNGNGILILENNPRKRIIILLKLLMERFDFVCCTHIGIKANRGRINAISIPTRLGINIGEIYSGVFSEENIEVIKNVKEFKDNFCNIDEDILQIKYYDRKFNIKTDEIKTKLNNDLVSKTDIKLILEVNKKNISSKSILVEMKKEELLENFMRNRQNGIYDSVSYLKNLFNHENKKKDINIIGNFNNIIGYKFYQSKKEDIEYLIKVIKNIIK